jgi:D-glutamate cyclase
LEGKRTMIAERKFSSEDIESIGENIDVLVSLDIGGRKFIKLLYPPVRERYGRPLCLLAAEKLRDRVGHGDFVLISSGMLIYPYETLAETDGPLGAASLARALQVGLGAKPVILTDQAAVEMTRATCRGASLNVTDIGTVKKTERTVSVIGFPVDEKEAKREADRLWQELSPKAIIAIERRGRNEKGVYHALPKGRNMNRTEAKMVTLYDKAKETGVLTIGIGDGGNEIGWGIIGDVIKEKMDFGDRCSCGCGGGVGDSTVVDVMVAASVSNWGAYGVAACLSVLMNNPEILQDAKIESRMLRECIDAGGIDGVSYYPEPKVDGLPEEAQVAIVTLLHEITKSGFVYPDYIYK